jgi:zeaxanthin glucosyltransferase
MKIGFISLPLTGHLNPMTALARKLQARKHEVVFFGVPDAEPFVRAANLDFVPLGEKEYPVGSIAKEYAALAMLHGEEVVKYSAHEIHPKRCQVALEQLPEKLVETGVEALVIDTIHFFVELVPMSMGMPFVHIWNVLHIDGSGTTPPCFFSWPHETTPKARARNVEGLKKIGSHYGSITAVAQSYAERRGLQIDWNNPIATVSKLAVITQTPKEFDFPGVPWPVQFHYTGPFQDDTARAPIPFPWEKLTGEPLIYASMGTLVNGLDQVFRTILDAVRAIPESQLVLSVGNNLNIADLGLIPSNAIVLNRVPQIEVLKRAALCITHAGVNTTLESLSEGVPMVAIPIGFDQPGIAARIAYHGVGEFIEVEELTQERLSKLIQKVLKNHGYRDKARYFQKVIAETRGLDIAADVIEQAFSKNRSADKTKKPRKASRQSLVK